MITILHKPSNKQPAPVCWNALRRLVLLPAVFPSCTKQIKPGLQSPKDTIKDRWIEIFIARKPSQSPTNSGTTPIYCCFCCRVKVSTTIAYRLHSLFNSDSKNLWFLEMLRAEDLQSFAVRPLLYIVEVAEH